MAGFIPEDSALKWYRNGELVVEDERVTVSYTPGKRSAARGDTMSVNSIVSVLTFTDPNENDTGEYECRIEGYDLPKQTVQLAVNQLDDGESFYVVNEYVITLYSYSITPYDLDTALTRVHRQCFIQCVHQILFVFFYNYYFIIIHDKDGHLETFTN